MHSPVVQVFKQVGPLKLSSNLFLPAATRACPGYPLSGWSNNFVTDAGKRRSTMSHPNVQIRPFQSSDAAEVYQAVRESLPQVSLWLPDLNDAITLEKVQGYIASQAEHASQRTAYNFVIMDGDDHTILGGCGLTQINWQHGYANLYYWVRSSKAGRGVASAAAAQLARYGIQTLGLQRIEIVVAAGNLSSLRVAEKIGAEREGLLRNRICVNGVMQDAFMYSLISSDLDGW